jgi:hydrogenase maturation protease
LQIEHSLDLCGRERVLLVDASCHAQTDDAPLFHLSRLQPQRDTRHTTHAMSPAALLQVFADVQGHPPPPTDLLTLQGQRWELGEPLSATAEQALREALHWARAWLTQLG